jgi:hypothetical protein
MTFLSPSKEMLEQSLLPRAFEFIIHYFPAMRSFTTIVCAAVGGAKLLHLDEQTPRTGGECVLPIACEL